MEDWKKMNALLNGFRAFVMESMDNDIHTDFDDMCEFLKASLETYQDMTGK